MSGKSSIEWTESTWNPVTGCSKVSPGCAHCYAERISLRFGTSKKPWLPEHAAENVKFHQDRLRLPLTWRKPRMVFVNSMSDLFHERLKKADIDRVLAVTALAPQHTYQILTKRPHAMLAYMREQSEPGPDGAPAFAIRTEMTMMMNPRALDPDAPVGTKYAARIRWPLPNVWLGVSAENQHWADERIPVLLETPAARRFVSAEPLLGPIDLERWLHDSNCTRDEMPCICAEPREVHLDWVIVGGESGPGARPMHPNWPRSIRDHCATAGVPFFFKQWGEWQPVAPVYGDLDDADEERIARATESRCEFVDETGGRWPENQPPPGSWTMERIGKRGAGRELDGRTFDGMPS